MTFQRNFVTTMDHWLSDLISPKNFEFYKIVISQNTVGYVKPNINDMLSIFFTNDPDEIYITRERLNLVDILSMSGGFASILMLFLRILAKFYSNQYLQEKLISKMFFT